MAMTNEERKRFIESLESIERGMSHEEFSEFEALMVRTLIRMRNGSPKIERLIKLRESGQIGPDDFFRLGGA